MNIVLGVCGGIAAYKAAELTRELRRHGAEVQVIMTANAEHFISPLTFAALSGRQVMTSLWQPIKSDVEIKEPISFGIEHIQVVQQADVVVIAPATANCIAKLAHGLADDLLSTACLAATCPVVIAPAMNSNMWSHPATRANVRLLRERNIHFVEPGSGDLACGMVGDGRLAEPSAIADHVARVAKSVKDMVGQTVLVTAGGTREPIDAVRFIGNRSSGKMGMAVAEAARDRGATVIIIHAAITASLPQGCEVVRAETAAELERAVLDRLDRATVVVMTAAVSDYTVLEPHAQKRKKTPQWDVK
ncbi:MAG: bifunctional phosphopantothenoylcysteine decarboxylase/phosphopantothenate--cysteine ligase CoaBC, partial [Terriglobus sp.]